MLDNATNAAVRECKSQGSAQSDVRPVPPCSDSEDLETVPEQPHPLLDRGLPHDLGHDLSPSLSDPRDDRPDPPKTRNVGSTNKRLICGECNEILLDKRSLDVHIQMHHPPTDADPSDSPPMSPSPMSPYIPSNPDLEPSESPPPPPDLTYPFVCPVCRARYKTERGLKTHRDKFSHYIPPEATVPQTIGIPSGSPSHTLLHILLATFKELTLHLQPLDVVDKLISICRRIEGSGKLPPANALLQRGLLSRAWQAIKAEHAGMNTAQEPVGDERAAVIKELHPSPPSLSLPVSHQAHGPLPKITGKGLLKELKAMKDVAAGPSGLGRKHLIYLCERADAADVLANALRMLLNSANWDAAKSLSEFRLRLLPKPNGKWRPIAIQETLLVAFHRMILRQTSQLRKMPHWQYAFESLAQVKSIHKAEELKKTHHLLTVDVKNAFNSLPHQVILFSLAKALVPKPVIAYVSSFLKARHSLDLPSVPAGVPQGDPLSMAMFCLSLIWPVETFLNEHKIIAYADDIVIAFNPNIHLDTVKQGAITALSKVGLVVEPSKCSSTLGGSISFMGTRIIKDGPYNLAEAATRALYEHLRTLNKAEISRHDRIRLLTSCIVPSVNYGPLIDEYPGPQSYKEVDTLIIGEIAKALNINDINARSLSIAPRSCYGLGIVLPHLYHSEMQEQRQRLAAGTFRELRKRKLSSAVPLRSFLPLALMKGPPLSNDQVLYIGECLSGRYQKGIIMGTCAHCKQPLRPRHHLVCKAINGAHVARHGKILNALVAHAKGMVGYVAINASIPINHLQPDLILGDGYGDLVIAVPWRVEKSYHLKMAKYRPLITANRAKHILPIVLGTDGTIHPKSAVGLRNAGVNLHKFLRDAASIILWHYTYSAAAYAELRPPTQTSQAIHSAPAPLFTPPDAQQLAQQQRNTRAPFIIPRPLSGSQANQPLRQPAEGARAHDTCTDVKQSIGTTQVLLKLNEPKVEAGHNQDASPSVELITASNLTMGHTQSIAPNLGEPSEFERSRGLSPPPLEETYLMEKGPVREDEPTPTSIRPKVTGLRDY